MATYSHDYTEADLLSPADVRGACVKVQHNLNKDQPHVSVWRTTVNDSWLEPSPRIRQVSNNEVRVYVGQYGVDFAIEVRVSD